MLSLGVWGVCPWERKPKLSGPNRVRDSPGSGRTGSWRLDTGKSQGQSKAEGPYRSGDQDARQTQGP